ncbi:hypothetical protein IMZ68_02775 [Candidatus Bathyarchaeota archaeon]|nr:hypothetical protein [Candidatus Bathyarchaeota archaeon]
MAKTIFNNKIRYASSALECIKKADACIIVTKWEEFKKLTPEDFKKHETSDTHRRQKNIQPRNFQG